MDDTVSIGKLTIPQVFRDGENSKLKPHEVKYVVLVATGSYNPPTYMHFRMFELARDAMLSEGYCVIGGYMSPVNDAYKKKGLVSAKHRLQMCELASWTSDFVMIDPWEANQSAYQRTLTVLSRIKSSLTQGEGGLYAVHSKSCSCVAQTYLNHLEFQACGSLNRSKQYAEIMVWFALGGKDKLLRESFVTIPFLTSTRITSRL